MLDEEIGRIKKDALVRIIVEHLKVENLGWFIP